MLRCILVDDEIQALGYLRYMCEINPHVEIVKVFQKPEKFLKSKDSLEFDLVFLDIEMPGMKGTEIAKTFSGKGIIFTTAYKHFAADAFELEAIDYLVKPLNQERLNKAIEKALIWRKNQESKGVWIDLPTSLGKAHVIMDDIRFIKTSEIDKRDKVLFMKNSEEILVKNTSFSELLNRLPMSQFCQISRSEIVNIKYISHFTENLLQISLDPDKSIDFTIGEKFKPNFLLKMKI